MVFSRREYNSVNSYVGFLGKDWNSNYEIKVVCYGENFVKVFLEDGQEQLFSKVDDFQYAIIFGQHATLRKTEEGFRYEKLCGDEYLFDNYYDKETKNFTIETPRGASLLGVLVF